MRSTWVRFKGLKGGSSHLPVQWQLLKSTRLPQGLRDRESVCQCKRCRLDPWVGKIRWRRKWQPTPVFLPGESHGWKILAGYSPWDCKESTQLSGFTFTLLSFSGMRSEEKDQKSFLEKMLPELILKGSVWADYFKKGGKRNRINK